MHRRPKRPMLLRMLFVALVAALITAPTAVWASHQFTDVPDDNVFHQDIDAIADAGVTVGCNPPENTEFCPDDEVTREQMAAFMNRLGALDGGAPVVDARTVQGQSLHGDIIEVDVVNEEGNEEECENTQSMLGPDHAFGTFFVVYQLLEAPGDTFTFDVNVAASDRDPLGNQPESGFLICFAMVDRELELPSGTYRLFAIESHEMAPVSD
jgi:hypothetical protein